MTEASLTALTASVIEMPAVHRPGAGTREDEAEWALLISSEPGCQGPIFGRSAEDAYSSSGRNGRWQKAHAAGTAAW